jgi:hypothetical protein
MAPPAGAKQGIKFATSLLYIPLVANLTFKLPGVQLDGGSFVMI